jgi:hypothetical protein
VILHGRNEAKLEDLRSKLLIEFPSRQIEIIVFDAATCFSGENYDNSCDVILKVTSGLLKCQVAGSVVKSGGW